MKLTELKKVGGIVSDQLVKKNIKWVRKVDGVEETLDFDVFIKRSRYGELEQIHKSGGESVSTMSAIISHSVFLGEGGKESLSYQDAFDLAPSLATVLVTAIHEVNGTSAQAKN